MNHLFYLIGKSASGKDTIYEELLNMPQLKLRPLVTYTTRPIRAKEQDGVDYHFADTCRLEQLQRAGKVIELRVYQTVHGPWAYFTVDDGTLDADSPVPDMGAAEQKSRFDILAIGTLESYLKIRQYYGEARVIPLYVEVDDGIRLERALKRERKPGNHRYEEMCRRFLADQRDFSEKNLENAGISRRFSNDEERGTCVGEIASFIRRIQSEG